MGWGAGVGMKRSLDEEEIWYMIGNTHQPDQLKLEKLCRALLMEVVVGTKERGVAAVAHIRWVVFLLLYHSFVTSIW